MIDLLPTLILCYLCFNAGWYAREIIAKYKVKQLEEELSDDLQKLEWLMKDKLVNLKIEESNGILYLYDFTNNTFICQGETKEEVMKTFHQLYPNKKGIVHEGVELWRNAK